MLSRLLALGALLVVTRGPSAAPVSGVVFADLNGNGVRDPGEPGLSGIAVSNQDTVVTTDASGTFHLSGEGTGVIFVSSPAGYRSVGPFWKSAGTAPLSFPLAKLAQGNGFSFAHASDTHISPASLARTQRLRAVVDSLHPDLVIITGDL